MESLGGRSKSGTAYRLTAKWPLGKCPVSVWRPWFNRGANGDREV
jgi:hypothetical protein